MDLFDKCYSFTRADEVKQLGYYPYFRAIEENEGPVVQIEGKKVIMAGSNNYLGFTAHPKVKEAALEAVRKYGTGCSGSRYLTGTLDLHIELEAKLAKFFGKEEVLLYSTGYQTGQGVIATLVQKGEYVISDKDNHACLVAGNLMAKSLLAEVIRYKHDDMDDLERVISKLPLEAGKLIVTDGVFSTTGTIANLPEISRLAKKYNARILCDDAHSVGVIGKGGRGTASHFNLENEIDMTMGTFSKTFASLGGFVAGEAKVINYLKHYSPALIFSASPTPAAVAAAIATLELLQQEPERIEKLQRNAKKVRDGFRSLGFRIVENTSAIVPVIIGDDFKTFIFWRNLYDSGIFVNAFVSPGVPPNMAMLRTSYMATHEDIHLDKIISTFEKIGKELGII